MPNREFPGCWFCNDTFYIYITLTHLYGVSVLQTALQDSPYEYTIGKLSKKKNKKKYRILSRYLRSSYRWFLHFLVLMPFK